MSTRLDSPFGVGSVLSVRHETAIVRIFPNKITRHTSYHGSLRLGKKLTSVVVSKSVVISKAMFQTTDDIILDGAAFVNMMKPINMTKPLVFFEGAFFKYIGPRMYHGVRFWEIDHLAQARTVQCGRFRCSGCLGGGINACSMKRTGRSRGAGV